MFTSSTVENILAEISEGHSETVACRQHLHRYPELPNREEKTARYIVEKLEEYGIASEDIHQNLGGHGVLARLTGQAEGNSEAAILLRADIDALPVEEKSGLEFASTETDSDYPGGPFPIAHACGHDCHAAMLLGAARTLAAHRSDFSGTVYLAFQPAEEGAPVGEEGGARLMLEEPVFSSLNPEPGTAFGIHVVPAPQGFVSYRQGAQHAASERIKITVTGEQVHGSSPWEGKDPMPAAADIISAMGQIYRQFDAQDPFTITIGHIEDKGRFNIVGQEVVLWGTVRCLKDGMMERVNDKIERTVKNIAAAYDCDAEAEFDQYIPPIVHSEEAYKAVRPALELAAGSSEKVTQAPAVMGYDDMSEFIQRYGGVYALLGVQDAEFLEDGTVRAKDDGRGLYANHSPHFYADDAALETGVRMHVCVALNHLGAPEI